MCFNCDSTEHRAGDLKCPKLAPKSRAAIQKRADSSEGNKGGHKMRDNMRELHQLRNEKKAHFRKLGAKTNEADLEEGSGFDESDWGDDEEEEGFAAGAVKSHKCFGVKCATICACNAICSLSLATPVLSMSNPVRTAVLTPVSILRTTKTVFPQHALVVSDTYFKLSQAYEAHERAWSWETSPRAWSANVRAIEMYNGLIPVPASSGFPVDGLRGALLNELLELRAEKKMSSLNISVTTPLQGFSDDEFSNILHKPSSIHLIPAGTALVDSPLGLGVRSPPNNDSVAYVRTGRCVIQPAATDHLSSQHPKIYAILKKTPDRILGGVLDTGAQRGATGQKSEILKHTGTSLLMTKAVLIVKFISPPSLKNVQIQMFCTSLEPETN